MAVILPLAVIALATLITMGFMELAGQKITLMNASVPLLLLVVGIAELAFFMACYYEEAARPGTTLEDVVVTHTGQCATTGTQLPLAFETLARSPAGAALLEEVTLHFARIRWQYRRIGPRGTGLPPITGGWDVKANTKL